MGCEKEVVSCVASLKGACECGMHGPLILVERERGGCVVRTGVGVWVGGGGVLCTWGSHAARSCTLEDACDKGGDSGAA